MAAPVRAGGTLIATAYSNHAVEVAATATVAGTYTVVVATNDSGQDATGDYALNLALVPGTPTVSDGDEGGAVTNGLNQEGQIHVGDLDQWTFTAPAGAAIIVRMGEVGGDSELYPWLRTLRSERHARRHRVQQPGRRSRRHRDGRRHLYASS